MSDDPPPAVGARHLVFESPWVRVVDKEVVRPGAETERYLVVEVGDYLVICPRAPDGRIVMVRQFRPAVEQLVWEFPGGQRDPGETNEAGLDRELREETAYRVARLTPLGAFHPDVGRFSNRGHLYFGDVTPVPGAQPEPGVTVELFQPAEIDAMIADGRFTHLQHIALWLMVKTAGLLGTKE